MISFPQKLDPEWPIRVPFEARQVWDHTQKKDYHTPAEVSYCRTTQISFEDDFLIQKEPF